MAAFAFLEALQQQVGPRRAGSEGERRALDWIEARCREMGWHPERDAFLYVGSDLYRQGLMLLLLAAGLANIWLPRWAGILLFVLALSFMFSWRKPLELRLARTGSENLLAGMQRPLGAYVADPERPPALIYCAHYDTARANPAWIQRLRGVFRLVGPLGFLGFFLYLALEVLRLLGSLVGGVVATALERLSFWGGWVALALVVPLFAFLLLSVLTQLLGRRRDSPGADDNGSGVAVLLELGRRLVADPPAGVEVFLAFWGAEEKGLFGSRQFVRRFGADFPAERTAIVNVDCVGVGEVLGLYAGQGTFRRKPTDPEQLDRLEAIARQHGVPTVRTWESIISGGSSDHAEWVERGYRLTASLIREDYRRANLPARLLGALLRVPYVNQLELPHIHSERDTMEVIVPERLEQTVEVAETYGRQLVQALRG